MNYLNINSVLAFAAAGSDATANSATEPTTWSVVLIGLGTVFVGLALLILGIKIMTLFTYRKGSSNVETQAVETPVASKPDDIPHDVLIAIISASVAEYIGKDDLEGLRILSLKKLN